MRILIHMALTHTVDVDRKKSTYSGSSQDELALVYAAKQFGVSFDRIDKEGNFILKVSERKEGKEEYEIKYKRLEVCEFNSSKMMMSVVYRDPNNKIVLKCK